MKNAPIFILGISERSGTHFLFHLLCLHPDCEAGGPIWENYLTDHLHLLVRYAECAYQNWNPRWDVVETLGTADVLLEDLGNGVINFLHRQLRHSNQLFGSPTGTDSSAKRLVTKNPSVKGLDCFFRLFPHARLLIIVRDGRDVVESTVNSFNLTYEHATKIWARGAESILRFSASPNHRNHQYLIVKFEDLVRSTEQTLRRIFAFLDLPVDKYDFALANQLPLIGSSAVRPAGASAVKWEPVNKPIGFDPTKRSQNWRARRHDRFIWMAGQYLSGLGYPAGRSSNTLGWIALNVAEDARRKLNHVLRGVWRKVRRRWRLVSGSNSV